MDTGSTENRAVEVVKTHQEQLERWRRGEWTHVEVAAGPHTPPEEAFECTPDFGCCVPGQRAPQEVRDAFCAADQPEREVMLAGFLSGVLVAAGHEVVS